MKFSVFIFLLLPSLLFAQQRGTFQIKKKQEEETNHQQLLSLKDYYPDSAAIADVRVLSYWVRSTNAEFSFRSVRHKSDLIPDNYTRNNKWSGWGKPNGLLFFDIQVETTNGQIDTLDPFIAYGKVEREQFPTYQKWPDYYPNPDLLKNIDRFTSFMLVARGPNGFFYAAGGTDSFVIDLLQEPDLQLEFSDLRAVDKNGEKIRLDPFMLNSSELEKSF